MTSKDAQRIVEHPRAEPPTAEDLESLRARFERPGADLRLFPVQAAALWTIERHAGACLGMGVGSGKTLCAMLAGEVLGYQASEVLIVAPAELRQQYLDERQKYRQHFHLADFGPWCSYSELSRAADGLPELWRAKGGEGALPKVVVFDEMHKLKSPDSGRTRKIARLVKEHAPKLVGMSASITRSSIKDFAHLLKWIFGEEGCPVPVAYSTLESWAKILDSDSQTAGRGKPSPWDWAMIRPLMESEFADEGKAEGLKYRHLARSAFRNRFLSWPGVVLTQEMSCDEPLYVRERREESPEMRTLRLKVSKEWAVPHPDGGVEWIEDPLRAADKLRQISQGFYYVSTGPPGYREYVANRNALLQACMEARGRTYDTPGEVRAAVERGELDAPHIAELEAAFAAGHQVWGHYPEDHFREAVWFDASVLRSAIEEVLGAENGILWWEHRAVYDKLLELAPEGLVVVDSGEAVPADARHVALSQNSHATGLNLQAWNRNYIPCPPANGGTWEQLLGRTHRAGQARPVYVVVWQHTPGLRKSLKRARADAEYMRADYAIEQRLLALQPEEPSPRFRRNVLALIEDN